ncbi:OPT oligopeptide transporter protein-domain-containing protein [Limtongia smithiae]|uniref:OPT oligopeptide transporter protein-domain-containing protein n=1 Tax=Limtongia smithiae TaxID=1125753 RepID=UPI0034CEE380
MPEANATIYEHESETDLIDTKLDKINTPQATPRALGVGLAIGSIVLFSNFQFGLQTGWISMMSLPSALLGYATFKTFNSYLTYPFTDVENVFVQSVAVAVGTGPLGFGLVGIIPALEKLLTPEEGGPLLLSTWRIFLWSTGIAFFGVFFAVPLRKQVIVKEKLRFPSGSATAMMIQVLHDKPDPAASTEETELPSTPSSSSSSDVDALAQEGIEEVVKNDVDVYRKNIRNLVLSFNISAGYTIAAYFVPLLRSLPIFGTSLAKNWLWTFQPSPAYVGQGVIMGLPTVSGMLLGAVLGWGILAPMATKMGWAPGPIDDWKTGGQGWILWISLAIMVVDSIISFSVVVGMSLYRSFERKRLEYTSIPAERMQPTDEIDEEEEADDAVDIVDEDVDAPPEHLVSDIVTYGGIAGTTLLCIVAIKIVFPVTPLYAIFAAVFIAFVLSILGVRALGETDLNPVSGIGKISQLLFALIVPRSNPAAVLINLIAGGVAEAGAQQAGDLMQDLKTGHLLGASPKAQFYAQVIGTAYSVLLSTIVYRLYNAVYEIPGAVFRIPTAVVWIDCSRLVTGAGLPPHAQAFALFFAIIFGTLSVIRSVYAKRPFARWIPSGVAVGVGIYNSPSFTLARFVGGLVGWYLMRKNSYFKTDHVALVISASGLVLGEGLFSIGTMILTSLHVPHF